MTPTSTTAYRLLIASDINMEPIFVIKHCRGSGACSVLLKNKTKLDLKKVRRKVKEILADTPYVIIVRFKGVNVSIYPTAKLLIHERDEEKVKKIAKEVYDAIL
jgi:hypothetical protein